MTAKTNSDSKNLQDKYNYSLIFTVAIIVTIYITVLFPDFKRATACVLLTVIIIIFFLFLEKDISAEPRGFIIADF